MEINFNNVRKQACFSYDRLVNELNQSKKYEGYLLVDPDAIAEQLSVLRMIIASIAMTFDKDDENFKEVYTEIYPEGKMMAEFKFESEE